ncbi:MAG: AMP-binding protein, partial [Candidatus Bathyarchaeia archaeon]
MTDIIWQPSQEHIRQSNVRRFMDKYGIRSYEELVKRSTDDTEWFWDAALKDLGIDWFKPYEKTLDASQGYAWAKWFVGGKLNIAHNCLDRYANSSRRSKIVCHWEGENSEIRRITYEQLSVEVNKLANGLKKLGVRKGDTVGIYMPMVPETSTAFFACLKIGAICVPLFSGFAASALASRLSDAEARILLTVDGFLRRGNKIRAKREADNAVDSVKSIEHVVVYKRLGVEVAWVDGRDVWWHELIRNQSDASTAEWMDSEDPAMILYTSGTSGKPKGAVHTHAGALAQCAKELCYNLDVKDEDTFFWLTDFGWMMGPWMIIGVQSLGGSYLL